MLGLCTEAHRIYQITRLAQANHDTFDEGWYAFTAVTSLVYPVFILQRNLIMAKLTCTNESRVGSFERDPVKYSPGTRGGADEGRGQGVRELTRLFWASGSY